MSYPSCGCGNTFPITYPSFSTVPCIPGGDTATLTNVGYLTLATGAAGKLVAVPAGGTGQVFLSRGAGSDDALVVLSADGQARAVQAVTLKLPVLNSPTGSTYPSTGSVQFIMVQSTGGTWSTLAAPTSGKWILQSDAGTWSLTSAGSIPGLDEVGSTGTTALKGMITVITEPSSGVFVLSKLRVADQRVVVGDVDDDGVEGFKTLGNTENLEHPKAKFVTTLRNRQYIGLDADGGDETAGLPQAAVTGAGAIADPRRMVYSPTTKLFYLAPATAKTQNPISLNSSATAPGSSYSALPGGHGAGISATYNYDNVKVEFAVGMDTNASNYTTTFAVRRDGTVIYEQDNDNNRQLILNFVDTNVPYGSHTYDIVWKKTAGSGTGPIIKNSNLVTYTLA